MHKYYWECLKFSRNVRNWALIREYKIKLKHKKRKGEYIMAIRRSYDFEKLRSQFDNKKKTSLPNNYYKFWEMKQDQSARIRFLPDKDENSTIPFGFLADKVFHNLTIEGKREMVPCLSSFEEECPICELSREYYAQGDKENGLNFYKKHQYIGQALIVEDPLPANDAGETMQGKVKLVSLSSTLYKIIEEAVKTRELTKAPFDYEGGTDFIIKMGRNGKNNSYTLSKFARNETDLSEDVIESVESQLIDLSSVLPKNPGRARIDSLLQSALTGAPVESKAIEDESVEVQEESHKPAVKTATSTKTKAPMVHVNEVETENEEDEDVAPAVTTSATKPKLNAADLLNKIKNR